MIYEKETQEVPSILMLISTLNAVIPDIIPDGFILLSS